MHHDPVAQPLGDLGLLLEALAAAAQHHLAVVAGQRSRHHRPPSARPKRACRTSSVARVSTWSVVSPCQTVSIRLRSSTLAACGSGGLDQPGQPRTLRVAEQVQGPVGEHDEPRLEPLPGREGPDRPLGSRAAVVVEPERLVDVDPELGQRRAQLGVGRVPGPRRRGPCPAPRRRPTPAAVSSPRRTSRRVPSGQDQVGWNVPASMAAMPIEAVSTRAVNFSDHAPYAGSPLRVEPAVGGRGLGQRGSLAGLEQVEHGRQRDCRLAGGPAGRVEHLRDQGPPLRHGDLGRVLLPGDRAEPVSAGVEIAGHRLLVPGDEVAEHPGRRPPGRRVSQPAGGVRSLDEVAQPGERGDVPAAACERRGQPLRPQHGPGLRDLVAGGLGGGVRLRGAPRRGRRRRPSSRGRPRGPRSWSGATRSVGRSARSAVDRAHRPGCDRRLRERPGLPSEPRAPPRRAPGRPPRARRSRSSPLSRQASSGIPSISSPSVSSSSACGTSRTVSGQSTRSCGSTAARSATISPSSSSTPRRSGRRGQNRVTL